ncbi:MAG: DUF4368 domain-containing protein [Clostridiales bacterium]|nr:DUF4368 domain-containing protein [Clostridiales bacterium]
MRDDSQRWIDLIAKYEDLQELDAPIVNELCEKICMSSASRPQGITAPSWRLSLSPLAYPVFVICVCSKIILPPSDCCFIHS